jgi:glycosyltransferase involved in cell wall biosynthesis
MRIAQVSPLYESVPPKMYGGTERVVSWLTEELVKQGHEVTLFASGDSQTKARLIPACEKSLRLNDDVVDSFAYHFVQLQKVQDLSSEFDLIHYHTDYFHFPLSRKSSVAQVTTLHGRLDLPDLQFIYNEFRDMPLISISKSQRRPLPQARFIGNVYHGLPQDLLPFGTGEGGYLAFLGRICPEKNLPDCIEVAKKTGIPLKIAAKVDKVDREYFQREIRPLLDHPLIEYVGEINDAQKAAFLGNALATLFLIDWPEPFGLVMVESMACGTPLIAYPKGSVPEVVEEGRSGHIVRNVEEAVRAVERIHRIDRRDCRDRFEQRFTVGKMTQGYLEHYTRLIVAKEAGSAFPVSGNRYEEQRAI